MKGNFSRAVDELMNGKLGDAEDAGAGAAPLASMGPASQAASGASASPYSQPSYGQAPAVQRRGGEEARITADMVITGSVSATADLRISGSIVGDVKTEGSLSVDGKIEGKVEAGAILLEGARIQGNVRSGSSITVGKGSAVNGDVAGERVDVDASITGNIKCAGTVVLRAGASVQGSISAASLSMAEGAEWTGDVEIVKARKSEA